MMLRKNEKGAMLVEVIAVLGLIALITPILFGQIQRRNEEILNAQVAAEMRSLKDALSAYVQAYEGDLATECRLVDDAGVYINQPDDKDCGWTNDDDTALGHYFDGNVEDYEIILMGRTVPAANGEYRPMIYAVAYQASVPDSMTLRRAAKTAALIGVEGGVVDSDSGDIEGMQGVWNLEYVEGDKPLKYAVAVTTSFDAVSTASVLKDASFSNIQASSSVQAPTVVGEKVGATTLFSVSGDTDNCITGYMNNNVTVKDSSASCAPVFEVDTTTGDVRAVGNIVLKSTENTGVTCNTENEVECNGTAGCVWLPGKGSSAGQCVNNYVINPAGTSMVNDIKLASHGGVSLSKLLPNWILKDVIQRYGVEHITINQNEFNCPPTYLHGVIFIPVAFNNDVGGYNIRVEGTGMKEDSGSITFNVHGADSYLQYNYCVRPTP